MAADAQAPCIAKAATDIVLLTMQDKHVFVFNKYLYFGNEVMHLSKSHPIGSQ